MWIILHQFLNLFTLIVTDHVSSMLKDDESKKNDLKSLLTFRSNTNIVSTDLGMQLTICYCVSADSDILSL